MTDTDKLRELLAKATPGPWQADDGDGGMWGVFADSADGDCDAISYMLEPTAPGYRSLRPEHDEANAALIVAAVNALPALLSTLAADKERMAGLEAENAALRHDLERSMARENALLNPTPTRAALTKESPNVG